MVLKILRMGWNETEQRTRSNPGLILPYRVIISDIVEDLQKLENMGLKSKHFGFNKMRPFLTT
jgi:hypothetical protein